MPKKIYTGIGSRELPVSIESLMEEIGSKLALKGWTHWGQTLLSKRDVSPLVEIKKYIFLGKILVKNGIENLQKMMFM